jgi:hypothetical protein
VSESLPHPLLAYFTDAASGQFPPVDGLVTVLPPLPDGLECSVAFTGHAVVATGLLVQDVLDLGPDGFGGSLAPDFLRHLAGPNGWIGETDVVLTTRGTGGAPRLAEQTGLDDHPRVRHARSLRAAVRVHGDDHGLVTVADGLAGRREISVELHPHSGEGKGHGRRLITDALTLFPRGTPVFAAVSPGNARSLRAFLASGFTPIGSEAQLRPLRQ